MPPERFDEPSVTDEGWSPKDVMYHVAAWAEEAATVLGRIAAGTHRESDPDTQALNDAWFEMGRGLDDDVVRIRFAKGRTSMRQAFSRLSGGRRERLGVVRGVGAPALRGAPARSARVPGARHPPAVGFEMWDDAWG